MPLILEKGMIHMQKIILLVFFIACCAPFTQAQDNERDVEIFAGFSALAAQNRITNRDIKTFAGFTPEQIRALTGSELVGNDRFIPGYGFETSATRYFSKRVGLTGDFSGYYYREDTGIAGSLFRAKHSIYYILGGPQVRFTNKSRVTPFVHALFGAAHTRVSYRENTSTNPVTANDNSTRLGMAFGGGLDVRVSKRISLRIFQMEYTPIMGKDRTVTANDGTVIDLNGRAQSKNFRVSAGIVF